ncbi:hypothetical protein [Alkalihalobacillus sp. AL-G]|uniref:hypothetical protein n=1 Tax=Alkalihalobacillus sp. AL-G TaxID=2926399 RepID=UPI00272CCF16|nr:hypothetical protein [Alkalihalobacillus sp. AL-G]WLD94442.1 hypothetical protein MOJ78_06010 [Alkalihalobacillus sp. AL-G]
MDYHTKDNDNLMNSVIDNMLIGGATLTLTAGITAGITASLGIVSLCLLATVGIGVFVGAFIGAAVESYKNRNSRSYLFPIRREE